MTSDSGVDGPLGRRQGIIRTAAVVAMLSVMAVGFGGGAGYLMIRKLGEQAVENYKAEQAARQPSSGNYAGDIEVRRVPAVVTNLAHTSEDWVRLEVALVIPRNMEKNPDLLVAEIRQDMVGFLRTISLAQIQGPSGLVHLREDLNERARIRSGGLVKELIVETFIVQ